MSDLEKLVECLKEAKEAITDHVCAGHLDSDGNRNVEFGWWEEDHWELIEKIDRLVEECEFQVWKSHVGLKRKA